MVRSGSTKWYFAGVIGGSALILLGIFNGPSLYQSWASSPNERIAANATGETAPQPATVRVETVHPSTGGLARRTSQPGSAHSFESAELFAKVSGYLQILHVDIGSKVKQGDLLAEIDVPEVTKDVDGAEALRQQSLAEVVQAEARVESAIADHGAAESRISQAEADVERWHSELGLAQKQFERIRELNELKGIEDRVVDERRQQVQAAQAAARSAQSAVAAARQQAAAAASRVALARADLEVSRAKVRVAESALERAKVMASYMKITSPYDGVITCRNFHRGAYVRSPDQGGQVPLLSVDRTDLMRVVVRIPEREVPFVHPGDKAAVRFDALPNREFGAPIARIAHGEESQTRTMMAEIDLENADDVIRDHMYGRVEIELEEAQSGVTVPSTCLVGNVVAGEGRLYVVEDGKVHLRRVEVGRDTGIVVEVLSGLDESLQVVVRPPGGLTDGSTVTCSPATIAMPGTPPKAN